jgi:hypothetical protein
MKKKKSNLLPKKSKKDKIKETPAVLDIPIEDIIDSGEITEAVISDIVLPIGDVATPPATKKIKPREREHYVNSREFEEEIREFYKTEHVTFKLGDSINKIAHGLSFAGNFINYSYKEEMVGDAIVKMFSALKNKKFKLDSGFNPFSYFTTIAFHAFINRIKKEKRHHETLNEYKEKVYTEMMLNPDENGGAHIYVDTTGDSDDDY